MSKQRIAALIVLIAASAGSARAELMQLGVQDFADGQILGCFSPTAACPVGWTSPTDPFNRFVGSDPGLPGATDFSAEWTFDLRSLSALQVSAMRIEIGLYDHDSKASGDQLDSFILNPGASAGYDLTAALNAALEAPGVGVQQEYNVVGFDLLDLERSLLLRDIAENGGFARFVLRLKGPALIKSQSGGIVEASGTNGAGLDFARLTLTSGASVPEPGAALLGVLGLAALAAARRRR